MRQHLVKSLAATATVALALAGCGGGGGDGGGANPPGTSTPTPGLVPFMGTTVQSLLDYMNQLIAQTDETSEPQPLDATPLPVDDTV